VIAADAADRMIGPDANRDVKALSHTKMSAQSSPTNPSQSDDPMARLQARLDRLEAAEAIGNLVARYARGADLKNDPAVFGDLLHEHAVWEANGFGRFQGRSAIVAALSRVAQERILWCVHYMVAPLIKISPTGRTASCSWYLWELAKMPDESGNPQDSWIAGYYDSDLSLGSEGWAFDKITLDIRLIGATTLPWQPTGTTAASYFFRNRPSAAVLG
jgi:SnoaL-like domain